MTTIALHTEATHRFRSKELADKVCGPDDSYLDKLHKIHALADITRDGLEVTFVGTDAAQARATLANMETRCAAGKVFVLEDRRAPAEALPVKKDTGPRGAAEPRTEGQKILADALVSHQMLLVDGPAGTGKTRLAIDNAVKLLKMDRVDRIVLSRPAIEAGERLGFLPGDMKEKVDPYMQPLYDSLGYHYNAKQVQKMMEDKVIEIAPIAFLRGRTLHNAAIVVDEAQNLTTMQAKMVLTRMGEGSHIVLTGDSDQIDLPAHVPSGLHDAMERLANTPGVAIVRMTAQDCVRSPLVARVLAAYASSPSR